MANFQLNAIVQQKIDVASGLMILSVIPDDWSLPPFKAGQYTVLGLPGSAPRAPYTDNEDPEPDQDKLIRRAYSITSASVENSYLEFYIALVRSGALTPRLFALKPGDRIFLSPKVVGMFTFDQVPEGKNILLIATGTGLAPYISMMRTHLSTHQDSKVAVIHGANHSWDLGYRSELSTMQRLSSVFQYVPIVSMPNEENVPWSGHTGFINNFLESDDVEKELGFYPDPSDTHVFLCGNPLMIEAMLKVLTARKFVEHTRKEPGEIHLEKFWK